MVLTRTTASNHLLVVGPAKCFRSSDINRFSVFEMQKLDELSGNLLGRVWTPRLGAPGPTILLTFDFLILFVPASKLLAFGSGDIGIVGAVHYGGNHALREREREGAR